MMATELSIASQQLIDARLDNIERALMVKGMERGDRRQIVSAIEDQILEMLHQSAGDEPTRDEVLLVFAKLDPPEAYLGLSEGDNAGVLPQPREARPSIDLSARNSSDYNPLAIISFVLMCLAAVGSVFWISTGPVALIPLGIAALGAGVCGTIGMYQCLSNRLGQRGLWLAITACSCAPAVSFLSWITLFLSEAGW